MSGFVPVAGTDFSAGAEPDIAARLNALGQRLGVTIFGISGARSAAHSVAVGGSANDPHTRGLAADIGVNGQTRASAGALTEAQLESVGLTRPFGGAQELNHVQLLPATKKPGGGGGLNVIGALGTVGKDVAAGALGPIGLAQAGGGAAIDTANAIGGGVLSGAQNALSDAAKAPFQWAVGQATDELKTTGTKLLVYLVLIVGGTALAVSGLIRATGSGPTVRRSLGRAAIAGAIA